MLLNLVEVNINLAKIILEELREKVLQNKRKNEMDKK
jgi:hypothetical protein